MNPPPSIAVHMVCVCPLPIWLELNPQKYTILFILVIVFVQVFFKLSDASGAPIFRNILTYYLVCTCPKKRTLIFLTLLKNRLYILKVFFTTYLSDISGSTSGGEQMKLNFFNSLKLRGFDTICLLNANDTDIFDFIQNFPHGATGLQSLILRCCNISDRGLEAIMEFLQGLYKLEIAGCNEITEQGLWSSLHPRLASLTINDCINVADECVCAVTQLLPALFEFNLQAYHVTDSALSYFSPKQTGTLNILRLQSCWEITNHGIVNIGMLWLLVKRHLL